MKRDAQRRLFDERELVQQEPETGWYAEVAINRPLRQTFTYAVPFDLVGKIEPGVRVAVPFGKGNRKMNGYCVGVSQSRPTDAAVKQVLALVDSEPILNAELLALTRWIADYYWCGWGQVLDGVVPAAIKHKSGGRWTLFYEAAAPSEPLDALPVKQRKAYEALAAMGRPATIQQVCEAARCGQNCVRELATKGFAKISRQRIYNRPPRVEPVLWEKPPELQFHQQAALDRLLSALEKREARTFLLHGVTGSGKTEVYLRAIAEVVRRGQQAIVLVPEISLTPQTILRFRQRFDDVAVLHSHLSDVDRNHYWRRAASGQTPVIVGARSAIFAPCPDLGLIILDEEHETTFKQESTPRYHAREVAVERGRLAKAPVILGSATPSLETFYAAKNGVYEYLSLPSRVSQRPMPKVEIVDLRQEEGRGVAVLSRRLVRAMHETLEKGGQALLLLNRRGFSTSILCPQCGKVEMCTRCEIALTYHKELDRLLCHQCDAEYPTPRVCSQCRSPAVRYSGVGTERVHEELKRRFPNYVCERMDSDTMRSGAHYERVLSAFKHGKIHILLGTQMIAKGLDFPNVHLVGVISADTARNLPDFRASERTFQLLAQVAGRTGRSDTPGRVLVQTFSPDDPAVVAAAHHDYLAFAKGELQIRRDFCYPPFVRLTRIILRSTSETAARQAIGDLAEKLREAAKGDPQVRILGPAPAPIVKLKDHFRMHLQVRSPDAASIRRVLAAGLATFEPPSDVEYAVDVDPTSQL